MILFFGGVIRYGIGVPDDRYGMNESEGIDMLRFLGICALGKLLFGRGLFRPRGGSLGKSILIGTVLGLIMGRINRNREENA